MAGIELRVATLASPLGDLFVAVDDRRVYLVEYAREDRANSQLHRVSKRLNATVVATDTPSAIEQLRTELAAFFAGEIAEFATPIHAAGTPFQERVWSELCRIPAGETRSYAAIARAVGDPNATRAVGAANGANPISILVPCHRVVRTGGALGGYGGGLDRKRWLLDHERQLTGGSLFAAASKDP